jgi:hypothetical protein
MGQEEPFPARGLSDRCGWKAGLHDLLGPRRLCGRADIHTSVARIASDGVDSCQRLQLLFQFECLDRSGLGLITPMQVKENGPIAVVVRAADAGSPS